MVSHMGPEFEYWLVPLAFLVTIPSLAFGPAVLACLWERRLVWPYVPADDLDFDPPTGTAKVALAGTELEDAGFTRYAALYDGKGKAYRLRYEFWLSPDGFVLAEVGGGKLLGIPLDAVWLFSLGADGRCLMTVNNSLAGEYDIAGLKREAVVPGADLKKLLARHRERMSAWGTLPYSAADPLADHAAFMRSRVEALVAAGNAGYLDDEQTAWRYSVKGAVLFAVKANVANMRRAFSRG
jgi:hypothetical protein